jgi:hypothetical protein
VADEGKKVLFALELDIGVDMVIASEYASSSIAI